MRVEKFFLKKTDIWLSFPSHEEKRKAQVLASDLDHHHLMRSTNSEFDKLVESIWRGHVDGKRAIDRWQNRVRIFRKKAKGWSINVEAELKKRKKTLDSEYNKLDIKAETRGLSQQERNRLSQVVGELTKLWEKRRDKSQTKG
jgi:hypothetical protein